MELPMNTILSQLPSGKVEMTLEELTPLVPPGFLQPPSALAGLMSTVVNLPLMDIVMRIPPDLLALRPDQKDVDAAVINMADPFTEEILREQAETARRQSGANIIEESQAPQEEFVPSTASAPGSIAPPAPAGGRAARAVASGRHDAGRAFHSHRSFVARHTEQPSGRPGLPCRRFHQSRAAASRPPHATGQIPTPVRMSTPLPPTPAGCGRRARTR